MIDVIFFISNQRIGAIRPDGSDECYPEFTEPNQVYWQLMTVLPDGKQAVLWSQEPQRNPKADYDDKDGLAFATSHLWRYDFVSGALKEINLPSLYGVAGVMPGGERLLFNGNIDNVVHIFTSDLDGGDRDYLYTGPGYAYGTSRSPDGSKVAHHITNVPGKPGYQIYVIDVQTKERTLIADDPEYIFFAPAWSPDNQWLVYVRCAYRQFPGHERADICISRADGSEHRELTTGNQHCFGVAYGPPGNVGGGSNGSAWSPDGRWVTYTRCLPGARGPWEYQPDRPNRDHFNAEYKPELARGGTEICLINPQTGETTAITHDDPPTWNFHAGWSPDAAHLAFCRAAVGCVGEFWVMDVDGGNQRFLTRGLNATGADHFRWFRLADSSWEQGAWRK